MRFVHWASEAWHWLFDLGVQVSGVTTGLNNGWVGLAIIAIALSLGLFRLVRWTRAELINSNSWLSKRIRALERKLIPVMLGLMATAGVLLIAAAIIGAIAYSNEHLSSDFRGRPIGLRDFRFAAFGSPESRFGVPIVNAKNITEHEVNLKTLVMVVANDGTRLRTMVRTKDNQKIDPSDLAPIASGAEFEIHAELPEPRMFSVRKIQTQFSDIYVHVEVDDLSYDVDFKDDIRKILESEKEQPPAQTPPGVNKRDVPAVSNLPANQKEELGKILSAAEKLFDDGITGIGEASNFTNPLPETKSLLQQRRSDVELTRSRISNMASYLDDVVRKNPRYAQEITSALDRSEHGAISQEILPIREFLESARKFAGDIDKVIERYDQTDKISLGVMLNMLGNEGAAAGLKLKEIQPWIDKCIKRMREASS